MKIKLIRNTYINGKFVNEGKIIDIDETLARLVVGAKKAEIVKDDKKDNQMTTENTKTVETKIKGKSKKK